MTYWWLPDVVKVYKKEQNITRRLKIVDSLTNAKKERLLRELFMNFYYQSKQLTVVKVYNPNLDNDEN